MCFASLVYDQYKPHFPPSPPWAPNTGSPPVQPPIYPPATAPAYDAQELRELIKSFKQALKAAQTFDRITGQPDCEDPEKATLEERVAEIERRLEEMGV